MEQTIFKNYAYFLLAFMLIGFYSCESESFEDSVVEESVTEDKKGRSARFDLSQECSTNQSTNLYAGQNILVGTVDVVVDGDNYIITYNLTTEGYCITETHLSVVDSPSDFPINRGGNPKIGQFEYSDSHDCETSVSYTVPTSKGAYIAAHAVVNCVADTTDEILDLNLPDVVSFCVTNKAPGTENGYFVIDIADGNSISGINIDAWCVDYESSLNDGECVDVAKVFSTYEDIPNDAFVNNGPFDVQGINDEINFIINYDFVGKPYLDTDETFIMGDVQLALWSLIEGNSAEQLYNGMTFPEILGDISLDRVAEVINMANQNDGFVPGCGEKIAVILIPQDGKQPVIISRDINCNVGDCDETAWGDGCDFPGSSWATYFQFQE